MLPPPADWFVALPANRPVAPRAHTELVTAGGNARALASLDGNVWLVGNTPKPISTASYMHVSVALIGAPHVSAQQLDDAARQIADGISPHQALGRFPGSYHGLAYAGQTVHGIGDVAGIRLLFTGRLAGCPAIASHARLLAPNPGLNHVFLLASMLAPATPLPLAEESPFRGVHAVPPGAQVSVDGNGRVTTCRWWCAPDDRLPRRDAAPLLREALSRSLSSRDVCEQPDAVGAELSGGMDSTALASLCHTHAPSLQLLTRDSRHLGCDDADWARTAAAHLPQARHHLIPPSALPHPLAGLGAALTMDAPGPSLMSPDRSLAWWRLAAGLNVSTLISGKGGDEVMLTSLPYLRAARNRSRRTARQHTAGWAALWNTTPARIRTHASRSTSYAHWIANCLTEAGRSAPGWEARPIVPPWLTTRANTLLLQCVADVAEEAEPLHDQVHQHTAMAAVRAMARWTRLQAEAASHTGLQLHYPFADRDVIEAVLSCRGEDRVSPFEPRPLLREAMRGIMPAVNLSRRTKGGYGAADDAAARRHRTTATALLGDESVLAGLGLIDPKRLAEPIARWGTGSPTDLLLGLTLQVEVWARAAIEAPTSHLQEVRQ